MRRVKTGWVAQRKNGKTFPSEGGKPDGIYIAVTVARCFLHYAGEKAAESGPMMEIPTDTHLLRELAEAFEEIAAWRDRGSIGPLHLLA